MRFNVSVEIIHGAKIWVLNLIDATWNMTHYIPGRALVTFLSESDDIFDQG